MKRLLHVFLVVAASCAAMVSISSCISGSGGTYVPIPDERVELFINQNNSGKDDDYERRWRHGGSFRPVRATAGNDSLVDVYVNGDGVKINLPAAGDAHIRVIDAAGNEVVSESFKDIEHGHSITRRIPAPGGYRLEIVIDGDVYRGEFLK